MGDVLIAEVFSDAFGFGSDVFHMGFCCLFQFIFGAAAPLSLSGVLSQRPCLFVQGGRRALSSLP